MFRRGRLRAEDLAIGIGPVPINGLSPRSAQPLVISVTMAPPVSNAEIYCAVQRRKAGDGVGSGPSATLRKEEQRLKGAPVNRAFFNLWT